MSANQALLSDIKSFSASEGIAASTLCRKAVNDGKLPKRLERGGSVTMETAERLRAYMDEHRAQSAPQTAAR
jgi:hypothetical protein